MKSMPVIVSKCSQLFFRRLLILMVVVAVAGCAYSNAPVSTPDNAELARSTALDDVETSRKTTVNETVKIATVHFAPVLGNVAVNRKTLVDLTAQAAKNGAKIIVHTEMATSGYSYFSRAELSGVAETIPGDTTTALGTVASKYGVYVVVGMPVYDTDTNLYYNSAVLIGPDGSVVGAYRKRNNLLEASYNAEDFDKIPVFATPYGKLGIVICADMFYPHFPRAAAVAGANILLAPANVAITTDFMQVRTFENNFSMVVANRYGKGLSGDKKIYFNQDSFAIPSPFEYSFSGTRSIIMTADGEVLVDIDASENTIGYGEVPIVATRTFPVVRKPHMYSLIGQDTLESYTASQMGQPPATTFAAAAIDPGTSNDPWENALTGLGNALSSAQAMGYTLRLAVLPENYFDTLDPAGLNKIQQFSTDNNVDVLISQATTAPLSMLVTPDGKTYNYIRTHRRSDSTIPDDMLSANYWVVDRDYGRIALMQGVDMFPPETTLVMAKMGVDVIAVNADDPEPVLNSLWASRTGNYVHIVVANRQGDEGIFLGGYKSNPSKKTGEGTVIMQINTGDVRVKKVPRFFDFNQILQPCNDDNC